MQKHIVDINGKQFKRTAKNHALKKIESGKVFFIVGANVNEYHFFSGWHLATHIQKRSLNEAIEIYNSFRIYLEPELGRYPVFYVEI